MSVFSEQVHVSISDYNKNVIYYDLEVSQKMADHHYFSFVWQYSGKTIIEPEEQAEAIGKYMASEVVFTFTVKGIQLMSKGKITKLESIDLHGSPVGLHVTGTSHTIAIDDMKKSRVFRDKNLQQIVLDVFGEENSGEFYQREAIVPTYTKQFDFKTQYNETSFEFLKRLSARYGQWFYFDGLRMQFGRIKSGKAELVNENTLHNFKIEARLAPHKTSYSGYNYNSAEKISDKSEKTTTGSRDRFAAIAGYRQSSIVSPGIHNSAYSSNAQSREEIQEMVSLQTAGRDANSIFYSGTSYLPIGVGQTFSIRNKNTVHYLLAIEAVHNSDANGSYSCQFRAIPSDAAAPHYTDVTAFASAQGQPAVVLDNNDPEKMGRIQVEYFWNSWDSKSDWMRVLQPYAGAGKGLYFRPEICEEVHVSFEGGNVDYPYVSGTYYNGKEMPEFFDAQNSIKGWKLRFGMLFKFIEKIGIWLSDPSGNEVHLSEETKSITITTPETLTLNCKNLIINASESITTTAGENIIESAGVDKSTTVGMINTMNVGGNHLMNVTGDFFENIEGNIEGNIESLTDKDRITNSNKGIETSTEEAIEKHSQKETKLNSGEKSNFF